LRAAAGSGWKPPTGELSQENKERRRAEEEVNRLNAELELRVAQRIRTARRGEQGAGSISYSVAHDLRAPLRHINGFAQILQGRTMGLPLDPQAQRYLKSFAMLRKHGSAGGYY